MQIPINLYAIKDIRNDEVIWNARGGAYQDLKAVNNKIDRLKKANPGGEYGLITWQVRSCAIVDCCNYYPKGVYTDGTEKIVGRNNE